MAAKLDIVVRGGQVVTATDVLDVAVGIKGDKIVALGPADMLPDAERVIDARGKILATGKCGVDVQLAHRLVHPLHGARDADGGHRDLRDHHAGPDAAEAQRRAAGAPVRQVRLQARARDSQRRQNG